MDSYPTIGQATYVPQQEDQAVSPAGSSDGHKKQLLNKLMANLLGKSGRSMNEVINGVKAVIGAYKNYAKERDTLNGVVSSQNTGVTSSPSGDSAGQSVQRILRDIRGGTASESSM